MHKSLQILILAALATGCTEASTEMEAQSEPARERTPVHVDSILPVEEEIRRFQAATERSAVRLENAAASRDELVARIVEGIETHDTAALATLVIDRAEFIDLYYPNSIYVREPWRLSPDVVWMLFTQNGQKGLGRALRRFGGSLAFAGYRCDVPVKQQGPNRLWEECVVVRRGGDAADPSELVLFGSILEREGRFKLVSWANDL